MNDLKLRAALFSCGALLGVVGAIASHEPLRWTPLVAPDAAQAPAPAPGSEPVPAVAAPASPAERERQRAFAAVRNRVITVGQELRRVEAQIQLQRTAYEDFMRRGAPFDLPAWHERQKELALEHEGLRDRLAAANAEYERYVCSDGRARAECRP